MGRGGGNIGKLTNEVSSFPEQILLDFTLVYIYIYMVVDPVVS